MASVLDVEPMIVANLWAKYQKHVKKWYNLKYVEYVQNLKNLKITWAENLKWKNFRSTTMFALPAQRITGSITNSLSWVSYTLIPIRQK